MRGCLPLSYRAPGGSPPGKIWEIVEPEKRFLALFWVKMSVFKLNFESQFDILYAIFCFNFSLKWGCSWHTKKKKRMIRITKYLINDCSSFWIMRVYGLQTVLSLEQSVPYPPPPPPLKKVPCPLPPPHTQKDRQRVACASAETVQCLRSQNS